MIQETRQLFAIVINYSLRYFLTVTFTTKKIVHI